MKIEFIGENNPCNISKQLMVQLQPNEELELVLPDDWVDALPVFYSLQAINNPVTLNVNYNFGCETFIPRQNSWDNQNITEENAIEKLLLTQYEVLMQIQDVIFEKKVENIAGYKDYKNNFHRALYFYDFPKAFMGLKIRNKPFYKSLVVEDGFVYSNDKSILYTIFPTRKDKILKIPAEVEIIAPKAFANCNENQKIIFPESIIYA